MKGWNNEMMKKWDNEIVILWNEKKYDIKKL